MTSSSVTEAVIFWAFAGLALLGGLGVVLSRTIIYSALSLIVVFLSIAGIFVLNNADFLAVAQTIVYAVGLTIVLLFGIMFTRDVPFDKKQISGRRWFAYSMVGVFTLALLTMAVSSFPYFTRPASPGFVAQLQAEGSTGMLGSLLFRQYALPFEVVSILLLVAMVGAIVIAKKQFADHEAAGLTYDTRTGSHPKPEALGWEASVGKKPSACETPERDVAGVS